MRKAIGAVEAPVVPAGTRAFIIGNGPSLNVSTLERLKGEVCFGVNRIHLIYPQTSWRPTYWLLMDLDGKNTYMTDIQLNAEMGYPCYVRVDIFARWLSGWIGAKTPEEIADVLSRVTTVDDVNYINTESVRLRDPLEDGKYNQGGSVGGALQLALAWGYDPVYMVGCDGGLQVGKVNHFTEYYDPNHQFDERNPAQVEDANKALNAIATAMHHEYVSRGRRLFNATVGGSKISGVPLADLEEVL